jgi:hypothetical protein
LTAEIAVFAASPNIKVRHFIKNEAAALENNGHNSKKSPHHAAARDLDGLPDDVFGSITQ